MAETSAQRVLNFWFETLGAKQWFAKDARLDRHIGDRFAALHEAARANELWTWRESPQGRLAEILLLDQFSRNLFRDRPEAFAHDPQALALAQVAVAQDADRHLQVAQRAFLYMPYMHSESLAVHDEALRLFAQPGLEENLKFERRHHEIIVRFGRYPHRNAILGRSSTPEEEAFLTQPGSSF
ncbi:DUF924 family protein [Halomonas sp. HP20-15]|uniref:DUF924 family protein n=1 Tax=Halomonas sp. HP20-15 TaxID=3085901 RepID=UPI002980DCD7|nr:DUF924 family protein [Halomonas sp. HP20-15]MDW5376991.1 DUF924 family protein [Halomonas sp. HP20-15]